ncbi:hypothetical protein GpartN1_g3354.t1 [Galdieria partita]|uniref:Uncharacterized protein n=1 Tax=Galdieria partita TaxID=83374 RepID=A0A9C7PVD9_9RHOD|nr:hypothetical protein GpartN1_g3354.t1 [Galdieria partita]
MNCFRCNYCFLQLFPKSVSCSFLKSHRTRDSVLKNVSGGGKLCTRPDFKIATRFHICIDCSASPNVSARVTDTENRTFQAVDSYQVGSEGNTRAEVLIDTAVSGNSIDKVLRSSESIAEQVYQSCKKYEGSLQSLYGWFDVASRRSLALVIAIVSFLGGRVLSVKRIPKYANLIGLLLSSLVSVSLYLVSRSAKQGCSARVALFLKEKGILSVTDLELCKIYARFGLTREEFQPYAREIYKFYLMGCIQDSVLRLTEIAQLLHLKRIFHLTGQDVGDMHQEVGRELYRRTLVYLDESANFERMGAKGNSPRNILRKKEMKKKEKLKDLEYQEETKSLVATLDKYFCICDRVFNDNESEEAYMYEWSRLRKLFSLSEEEIEKRLNRVRIPLYETLAKAVLSSSQVDSGILETACSALSIEKEVSSQIHVQVYRYMLETMLQNNESIPEQGLKEIQRVRQVFAIDVDTSKELLRTVTIPVFQRKLEQALQSCVADWISRDKNAFLSSEIGIDLTPYIQSLRAKIEELRLSRDDLFLGFRNGVSGATASCFKKAMNFLRVQNVRSVEQETRVLITLYKVAVEMLEKMEICDSTDGASQLVLQAMTKISSTHQTEECRLLYRIFLNDCLRELPLGHNKSHSLELLRRILSLSELDANDAYRNVIEPIYQKRLQKLVESQTNFIEDDKEKLRNLEETLSLPSDSSKQVKLQCYKTQLAKRMENNRIYSAKEAEELDKLRNFLSISKDEVVPIHIELASPVFEQSIKEAMGSTGMIPAEYHDALDRLGERLGLPEHEAKAILYKIAKVPMKAYVDRAIKIVQQRSAPRGANETRDIGDDPLIQKPGTSLGIEAGGNVAMELSNLVEYCVRNRLILQRTVTVNKEDGENTSNGDTSEPETRTYLEFPVTLRDLFDPAVLQELYRQYLIQCFAVKSRSEKQRYFRDLDRLAGVFGLTNEEVNKVHSNLGTVIYNQYLSQALSEGRLEQKDLDFLNNIQQSLSMSPELCRGLIRDAKRSKVSSLLQTILNASKVTPSQMKELREIGHRLEVSLVDNTISTKDQRKRLFTLEVDVCIENGLITVEDQSLLRELQQEYSISDEEAKILVIECIQNRCSSHLIQAAAYLRQSKPEQAIGELNNLIKFGIFLPDEIQSSVVSTKEREELLLLYQASTVGETKAGSQEYTELLRALFGFHKTE